MANWKKLRIYLSESIRWKHKLAYQELVKQAHAHEISGATVIRAIEGYHGHHMIQAANILALSGDLPILVEIIDEEDKIRRFYDLNKEMLHGHLVTIEPVELLQSWERVIN
ncbi:MAG: DUF190 domain-containing protein [Microcoleaceae cyanobacterium]